MPTTDQYNDSFNKIISFFENLKSEDMSRLTHYYDNLAEFKDPFNHVRGIDSIRKIFEPMFNHLDDPKFMITNQICDSHQCFLVWEFHFKFKKHQSFGLQTIKGGSHLILNELGLIVLHQDYWDSSEEIFEKIPVLGHFLRFIKKRLSH
jgi:SnoaL-like domain